MPQINGVQVNQPIQTSKKPSCCSQGASCCDTNNTSIFNAGSPNAAANDPKELLKNLSSDDILKLLTLLGNRPA